jgi:tripartite-type tricarboxylate transporter receptor subunit TctC
LNAEAIKIFYAPELKERLFALGLEPASEPLANTNTYIKSEIARWAKVVKAAKIVVE